MPHDEKQKSLNETAGHVISALFRRHIFENETLGIIQLAFPICAKINLAQNFGGDFKEHVGEAYNFRTLNSAGGPPALFWDREKKLSSSKKIISAGFKGVEK